MIDYAMLAGASLLYQFDWIPSSVAKAQTRGIDWLSSNRSTENVAELPEWGKRAERAQDNYLENFAPFAVAVLAIGQLDGFTSLTAIATTSFFLARCAHLSVYVIGLVYPRTFFWFIGLTSTLYLYFRLFKELGL